MRILIVEDDEALCSTMRYHLEREGFETDICNDGESALDWIMQPAYALIILDRMLPGLNGLDLLARIRSGGIAAHVLIITALGEVEDRVAGLDAGADDYMVKPFAMSELLARVRSFSRRSAEKNCYASASNLQAGDLLLDVQKRLLRGPRGTQELSKREADLLLLLISHPGEVQSREMLFTRVWGPYAEVEYGNLDSYIHFLRKRIAEIGSACRIRTRRGVGYQLEARGERAPC